MVVVAIPATRPEPPPPPRHLVRLVELKSVRMHQVMLRPLSVRFPVPFSTLFPLNGLPPLITRTALPTKSTKKVAFWPALF